MSSSVKKVCATGPGSAMPVVSITTRSNLRLPPSRFSLSVPRIRIKSPRTVQQMQPLFISTICSSPVSMMSLSTPISPNSFSITAMRWPWSSLRIRLSSVVLPLPRNPVRIVTGTMLVSSIAAPDEGRDYKSGSDPDLCPYQQQSFQVLPFGKLQGDGMVGGGAEALDDLGVGAGVERGARDDRLEELGRNAARARERGEEASGGEQLEREQVDVLVGARGVARLRRRRRELGRIEDHHLEAGAAVAQGSQLLEHVAVHEFDPAAIQRIGREVVARDFERRRRALDGGDTPCAPGERGDREAAGVGEAIEHLASRGELAHAMAVLALVEEEAGLLPLFHVDAEVEAVFHDRAARGVAVAPREAHASWQGLEFAHLGVRAFEDRLGGGELRERVQDQVAPALDAGGEELRHQHVGIAVDDQAGQAVGLTVHQAQRVGMAPRRQRLAQGESTLDPAAEKGRIHLLRRVEGPHARPDLRLGAVPGLPVKLPAGVLEVHRIAGTRFADDLVDTARKEPRMAPFERLLASPLEHDCAHFEAFFFGARGCAAS